MATLFENPKRVPLNDSQVANVAVNGGHIAVDSMASGVPEKRPYFVEGGA